MKPLDFLREHNGENVDLLIVLIIRESPSR
jgi:hypothetical protein